MDFTLACPAWSYHGPTRLNSSELTVVGLGRVF